MMYRKTRMKILFVAMGAAAINLAVPLASPAQAQDANVEGRVFKLEKEMQAVQRKVFAGSGNGKFFEPEISPEDPAQTNNDGDGSPTAAANMMARVDALEAQLASLTGQVEQQGNSTRTMEARLKTLEADMRAQKAAAVPLATANDPDDVGETRSAAKPRLPVTNTGSAGAKPATGTVASSARKQAVAAIEKPNSGDGFNDGYDYGYRLWEAKFYPEAQAQLAETVAKYPKNGRISYARNLLGRAWLDDKKPATAVKILYDNYKEDPRGARAPDSLYHLGIALGELKKTAEACEAFTQLEKAYPDTAAGRLSGQLASGRTRMKCK
jgi:TolA-binding protein